MREEQLRSILAPPENARNFDLARSLASISTTLKKRRHELPIDATLQGLSEDQEAFAPVLAGLLSLSLIRRLESLAASHFASRLLNEGSLSLTTHYSLITYSHGLRPDRPLLAVEYSLSDSYRGRFFRFKIAPFIGEDGIHEVTAGVLSENRAIRLSRREMGHGINRGSPYRNCGAFFFVKAATRLFEEELAKHSISHWNVCPSSLYAYAYTNLMGARIDGHRRMAHLESEYLASLGRVLQISGYDITFGDGGSITYKTLRGLIKASNDLHHGRVTANGQRARWRKLTTYGTCFGGKSKSPSGTRTSHPYITRLPQGN